MRNIMLVSILMGGLYAVIGFIIAWVLLGLNQGQVPNSPPSLAYLLGALIGACVGLYWLVVSTRDFRSQNRR